jgi:transposase
LPVLLRRVKQVEVRSPKTLRFVGIDDWAWCKGQRYGTIVVDLEASDVVDLLPDRDAATVSSWLRAHAGVEPVSRDRSSAYSQAASEAAPKARQVADRWHLGLRHRLRSDCRRRIRIHGQTPWY